MLRARAVAKVEANMELVSLIGNLILLVLVWMALAVCVDRVVRVVSPVTERVCFCRTAGRYICSVRGVPPHGDPGSRKSSVL